ncbi:MAG: hypothetical protein LBQ66_00420 [Planctomycetaceae bacterium]|jgi:hypothetical protein|nr:hypothetical protein [Planctomycetaceae bacterium]
MEPTLIQFAKEGTAFAAILFVFLGAFFWGIPKLIAYQKEKDELHRQDVKTLIENAKAERETFYKTLDSWITTTNERLESIETTLQQWND